MAQLEDLNIEFYWFHSWCDHGIQIGSIYKDKEPRTVQSWIETHGPFETIKAAYEEAELVRNERD